MLRYCSILFIVSLYALVEDQYTVYKSLHILNEEASFVCDFNDTNNMTNVRTIQWLHSIKTNNRTMWKTLYDNGSTNPLYNNIISVATANRSSILTVKSLTMNTYFRCIVIYGNGQVNSLMKTFNVTIIDMEPPSRVRLLGYKNSSQINVTANEIKSLNCFSVGGIPVGNLSWTRSDTNEVFGRSSSSWNNITISPIREDNGVIYTCILQHPALNRSLIAQITLNVLFSPTVTVSMEQINDTIINLTCMVDSNPPDWTLSWTRDGIHINEHSEFLTIEDENGNYSCTAKNSIGIGSDDIQIHLISKTDIRSTSEQTPITMVPSSNNGTKRIFDLLLCVGICIIIMALITICTVIYTRQNSGNRTAMNINHEELASFRMKPRTQEGENLTTNLKPSNYTDAWA